MIFKKENIINKVNSHCYSLRSSDSTGAGFSLLCSADTVLGSEDSLIVITD